MRQHAIRIAMATLFAMILGGAVGWRNILATHWGHGRYVPLPMNDSFYVIIDAVGWGVIVLIGGIVSSLTWTAVQYFMRHHGE